MAPELTWYVTFISIVFGVYITVWIHPLAGTQVRNAMPPKSLRQVLLLVRGIFMFVILICLWWWYAIFLGKIDPAIGFLMYLYEFTTLAIFAIGFRYWDHPILFPVAVMTGSTFMLMRFIIIILMGIVEEDSKEGRALVIAVVTLVIYIVFILGTFAATFAPGMQATERLNIVHNVITALLLVGIIATFLAVEKAEGFIWGKPLVIERAAVLGNLQ